MVKGQKYLYLDKNSELFTHGASYQFIESGYHWNKEYGFVIWVTTDEYPGILDADYGCAMSPADFKRCFWKV